MYSWVCFSRFFSPVPFFISPQRLLPCSTGLKNVVKLRVDRKTQARILHSQILAWALWCLHLWSEIMLPPQLDSVRRCVQPEAAFYSLNKYEYLFEMAWGWVNDKVRFLFVFTIPLKTSKTCSVNTLKRADILQCRHLVREAVFTAAPSGHDLVLLTPCLDF